MSSRSVQARMNAPRPCACWAACAGSMAPAFLRASAPMPGTPRSPSCAPAQKLGWGWIAVLKRQDMEVYQEAQHLSQGQPPGASFYDQQRGRQVRLWEVQDLDFSKEYGRPVRVVRSEERWGEQRVRGGRKEQRARASQWVWAASAQLNGYAPEVVYPWGAPALGDRKQGLQPTDPRLSPPTLLSP